MPRNSRFGSHAFAMRPGLLARIGVAVIVALILPGALAETSARENIFELDGAIAVVVSTTLLLGAATAAAAWALRGHRVERPALAVAALFALLAIDELTSLHQHVEAALGVSWELVYAPLVVIGVGFAVPTVRGLPARLERRLLPAGALLWLIAQAINHRGFTGSEPIDDTFAGAEELLEMGGSLLFWLAFAYAARDARERTTGVPRTQ